MPKKPSLDSQLENEHKNNIIHAEAFEIMHRIIRFEKFVHPGTEIEIEGNKIDVNQFKDFIIERIRADFEEELQEHVDQEMQTKSDVPLQRQNGLRSEDFQRIRNGILRIEHPWHDPKWQKEVLADYLERSSRKPQP